ncbi:hypothetical protein [Corynebacterium casei]|uniref:hypothetical protein n=1 Tax=Corynebacterium casei TaxID=160386 RepID=UPI003F94501A
MNSRQVLRTQAAIIFDFDGTVALGHGPVLAYAKAIRSSPTEWCFCLSLKQAV